MWLLKWTITTLLRPGVKGSDEGVVLNCLHDLGFNEASELKIGQSFYLTTKDDTTKEKVEEMCKRLLVNTILYDFKVEPYNEKNL